MLKLICSISSGMVVAEAIARADLSFRKEKIYIIYIPCWQATRVQDYVKCCKWNITELKIHGSLSLRRDNPLGWSA